MKKQIIFLAAVVLLATACNKKLDINPTQSVPQELVFDNNANILAYFYLRSLKAEWQHTERRHRSFL